MDRNVENGFSFVEILVSMVIVGFVALLVGLSLSSSLRLHKQSFSNDDARAIAKEKLAQLQDPTVTISSPGSESVSRNNKVYTRYWAVTQSANMPDLANITVKWDNNTKQIQVSGYIEADVIIIPCPGGSHHPSAITTNPTTLQVLQSAPVGTLVCTFSTTDDASATGDIFTYTFVAGGTDNSKFTLSANELRTAVAMASPNKSITVKTTDCQGYSWTQTFTIPVTTTPINNPPEDIMLSNTAVNENQAAGTTIGTLTTTDPDFGQSFTYILAGGADQDSFNIPAGTDALKTAKVLNYESKTSLSVIIRTTDNGSPPKSYDETFAIAVNNLNDTPTNIIPSKMSMDEHKTPNYEITSLDVTDDDKASQSFTYALVTGIGSTDNDSFNIYMPTVKFRATRTFNYETQPKHVFYCRMKVTDNGTPNLSFEKQCTVTVNNINETPYFNSRKNDTTVNVSTSVTFTVSLATDPDGDAITYSDSSLPAGATFNTSTRLFSWTTPSTGMKDTMYFKAKDPGGLFDRDTVRITVLGPVTYPLTLRGLRNNNGTYSGSSTAFWVGAYLRHSSYVVEVLCFNNAINTALTGKTVANSKFRFNISSLHAGGATNNLKGYLFEQNKGMPSTSATYNTYTMTAWSNSLGTKELTYNGTTGWYEISSTGLNTLMQTWANDTTKNKGLILGGDAQYYDYYWIISNAELVITSY